MKLQIKTDGDDASVEGWKKKYVGPDNLTEINNGLDNLQAALLQLWPWDYTAQVIRRVLNRYSYMVTADTMRCRVSCIEKFFDDVLDRNAKSPHLPPMGYAEAEELAKITMERMGVPPVVGVVADYYRQVLNPGVVADRGQEDRARGGGGVGARASGTTGPESRQLWIRPSETSQSETRPTGLGLGPGQRKGPARGVLGQCRLQLWSRETLL